MFFVYDRTGKEAVIAKAILRLRAEEKEPPTLSQLTIGGVSVLTPIPKLPRQRSPRTGYVEVEGRFESKTKVETISAAVIPS